MKCLIVTSDEKTLLWSSLTSKLKIISDALNVWDVEVQHHIFNPAVANGRISHTWLNDFKKPFFDKGYDVIALHFTIEDRDKFKLLKSLRGSNTDTKQEWGDFWFVANENTRREGLNQFIQTFLHEFGHEYHQQTKTADKVHEWHDKHRDIIPYIKKLNWAMYQPVRQQMKREIFSLRNLIAELKKQFQPQTLLHPVDSFKTNISQPYGNISSRYPKTGRHIGTDYRTPFGTPINAPWDGEVTQTGEGHEILGNWCTYTYTFKGITYAERWVHLRDSVKLGKHKRGNLVAYTGNTGMSTGAHLHQDIWYDAPKVASINRNNWSALTINPQTHYT